MSDPKVINSKCGCVCYIKGKVFIDNLDRLKTPGATCGNTLCVDDREINGADLAVERLEPIKVATVALGVDVAAGYAVKVINVVVYKILTFDMRFFNQSGYLVNGCCDIGGEGSIKNLLNGAFFYPRVVGLGDLFVIFNYASLGELIAALIAVFSSTLKFFFQYPPILFGNNDDRVTNSYGGCNFVVINVDRVGVVNEINTVGSHSACIGDLCNHAGDLDLCTLFCFTSLVNGHFCVSICIDLGFFISQQSGSFKFNFSTFVVLDCALNGNVVANLNFVGVFLDLEAVDGVVLIAVYNDRNGDIVIFCVVALGSNDFSLERVRAFQDLIGAQLISCRKHDSGITERNTVKYRGGRGRNVRFGSGCSGRIFAKQGVKERGYRVTTGRKQRGRNDQKG